MEQFIRDTGLATLITKGSAYPAATHIPVELEQNANGETILWGHISKANPQWKDFEKDEHVLVVFLSPVHHYISSSWYSLPNAPTWNYMSVHVTGRIKIIEGEELWECVRRLTNRYEQKSANPVSLDTLPPEVQQQMNGIIGFEISIDKMEAAFKLSQNRDDEDHKNIIMQLRSSSGLSAQMMAEVMEQQRRNE